MPFSSLAAFEKSFYADDWRDPMRLYLVRRARSFIQQNYAATNPANGRKFQTFEDGTRSYFPARQPKPVKFKIGKRLPLPIGTQDVGILDSRIFDEDADRDIGAIELFNDEN
jgi:hypothetical protein